MSDSEKPFEPTPRRIAKARSEGNVARSAELAANASFAAGGLALAAIAPSFAAAARTAIATAALGHAAPWNAGAVLAIGLVPVAAAAAAGACAGVLQNGGLAGVTLAIKMERLNPLEGIKRVLSRETVAHSVRSTLAFACACGAMAPIFIWSAPAGLRAASAGAAAGAAWMAACEVACVAGAVGFCFSIGEYGAARGAWLRKLRMDFDERRREAKEEEGDPIARGRRRSLHRALLRTGAGRVKDAAFVVTNPTHVAVALEYRPPRVCVPRVLARAAGDAARRVREIAERHRVPIVENAWLARALYRDGRAGEAIPVAHYVAVAEVVVALARAGEAAV